MDFTIERVSELIPFNLRQEVISDNNNIDYDFVSNNEPFQVILINKINGLYYWQKDNKRIETEADFIRDCQRAGIIE